MQDGPTHTASGFDLDAWREELLALNPWARGLTIDEDDTEFAAARQKATLARHANPAQLTGNFGLRCPSLWLQGTDAAGNWVSPLAPCKALRWPVP
jgi:hypothetical protein